jgi:excisionase family DNA binding protein
MQGQNFAQRLESRLLGSEQAATYLGVAPPTLLRLIARGIISPVQIPGVRRTLIDKRDLDALVESGKLQRVAQPGEAMIELGADE